MTEEGKLRLLLNHLQVGDAQDYEKWFSELEKPYSELSDVSRRHDVFLDDKAENRKLAARLKQIDYISSWTEKRRTGVGEQLLVFKVRAKK